MLYGLLPLHNQSTFQDLESRPQAGKERAHPFSYHNKLSIETSVTFSPLWIALWVSFVGVAGIYARTAADNHRMYNGIMEVSIEERRPMVDWREIAYPGLIVSLWRDFR